MLQTGNMDELLSLVKKALAGVDFGKIQEKCQFGGYKRSFWAAGITVDYNAYPLMHSSGLDHRIMYRTFTQASGSSVIVHYTKLPEGRYLVTDFCINTSYPGSSAATIISYSCARNQGIWR